MSESSNPLYSLHQQANAEFQPYGEIPIVSTFGQVPAEYAAIRKTCALFDEPQRGILELTGRDRLEFLNNLVTNQTWDKPTRTGLREGEGVYAFFLNNKGRIVSDMHVLERGDRTLLALDARMVEPVRKLLDRYLFGEQVKMVGRVGELHTISLHGPGAGEILGQVMDRPVAEMGQLASVSGMLLGHEAMVWRDDATGAAGFHVVVAGEAAGEIWTKLLKDFSQSDQPGKRLLRPIGWAAFNTARIEGGRPIFGIDFDESILPGETGQLERAVSFSKGCYLGQEIVARMHSRGQLARQLVGIRFESDALPIAGAKVYDESQNEIGGITSSSISPVLSNIAIALGYVRKAFLTVGTSVYVPAEGAMHKGVVAELPFVR